MIFSQALGICVVAITEHHRLLLYSFISLKPAGNELQLAARQVNIMKTQAILFNRANSPYWRPWTVFLIMFLVGSYWPLKAQSAQSPTGTIEGTVKVTNPDGRTFGMPDVRLKLSGVPPASEGISGTASETGEFRFTGLLPGTYTLAATLQGFKKQIRTLTVRAGETAKDEFFLELEGLRAEVEVQGKTDSIGIATTEAAPAAELQQKTLQTVPLLNERFQEALPLVPGIVRGPDGQLNVKGARAGQSGLTVNSTNVTDPVTGEYAINLPVDAIQSVQVLTNPYAPEYGKFSGGVTSIETRRGTDSWKATAQNFFPRVRRRDGSFVGLGAVTPRMTFGGPVIKDKVQFFQSLEYRFVRTEVEVDTLPPLNRDRKLESFDSISRLDWDIDATNHLTTSFSLFPQKIGAATLNTFNPIEVTPNFKQRGFFWAVNERKIFGSGSFLETFFSIKQFDANIAPNSDAPLMNLTTGLNTGSFFNRQDRESRRYEAQTVYTFTPPQFTGSHLMKLGFGVSYNTFDGQHSSLPVRILRADGTIARQVDFIGNTVLSRNKTETGFYFQDKWIVSDRLTLEYGARYDRDTIADENNFAPRLGFAFVPVKDGRTVVRGGFGLFYDKVSLNVATFPQLQQRVLTQFAADGTRIVSGPQLQSFVLNDNRFRTPDSTNWNIEFDREWIRNLFVRVGYQQREGRREFVLDPLTAATGGQELRLSNRGSSRYREFQITTRYKISDTKQLTASYTRSKAIGNLNDFNSLLGNFENPVIRPDERSRLPWDAANRFVLWGDINLKYKINISPVLDIHTGFPVSVFDENRDFVGGRNRAGRFPTFASLDLQATKGFKIRLGDKKYPARIGLKVFNLTNHFNPRDFQGNLTSPNFGRFSNTVDRQYGGKFVLDF